MGKTANQSTLFSWDFIWSVFVRMPRVRDWLFWSDVPSRTHVIKSLVTHPMLNGFIFESIDGLQYYEFPDIGDLETVYAVEGDTMLGFAFGFEGVNPVIPIMYCFQNDSYLTDPRVKVRRTARRFVRFSDFSCYFHIEFCWMISGILLVKTSVQAYCETSSNSNYAGNSVPGSVMDEVEIRIFSPEDTLSLVQIVSNLYSYEHFTRKRRMTSSDEFHSLPPQLLTPSWSYTAKIREPNDIAHENSPHTQPQHQSNDAALSCIDQPISTPGFITLQSYHDPKGNCLTSTSAVTSNGSERKTDDANFRIIKMWTHYCKSLENSRLDGTYRTSFYKSVEKSLNTDILGALDAIGLGEQDSTFKFLCTTGVPVRRRIHQLCTLLHIDYLQPQTDKILYKYVKVPRKMGPSTPTTMTMVNQEMAMHTHSNVAVQSALRPNSVQLDEENQLSHCCASNNCQSPIGVPDFNADNEAEFSFLSSLSPSDTLSYNKKTRHNDLMHSTIDSTLSKRSSNYIINKNKNDNESFIGDLATEWTFPYATALGLRENEEIDTRQRQRKCNKANVAANVHRFKSMDNSMLEQQQTIIPTAHQMLIIEKQALFAEHQQITTKSTSQDRATRTVDVNPRHSNNDDDEDEDGWVDEGEEEEGGEGKEEGEKDEEEDEENLLDSDTFGGRKICGPGGHEEWECGKCGIRIQGKRGNLKRHVEYKHLNIRRFSCSIVNCGRKFHSRPNLKRHQLTVHAGRPFQCNQCPRNFKQQNDLTVHIKTSHVDCDEKLACDICGGCFGYRSSLNRHRRTVHGKKDDNVIPHSQLGDQHQGQPLIAEQQRDANTIHTHS